MKVKPLSDHVLIKVDDTMKKTKGGIFIPDVAQEKADTGVIEDVGTDPSVHLKIGDKVKFPLSVGMYLSEDEVIMKQSDVICTYEK